MAINPSDITPLCGIGRYTRPALLAIGNKTRANGNVGQTAALTLTADAVSAHVGF